MSWQDGVSRQIAAVTMARAMQAAARGEELPGLTDEPLILSAHVDDGERRVLSSGGARRELTAHNSERSRRGIDAFCADLAGYLKSIGADVSAGELRRGLQRLASEGWDIEVTR